MKANRLTIGNHPVDAAREAVTVDLEAMSKSWLGDAFAAIDLRNQSIEIWMEVLIDERDEVCNYRGKEYTTEPRGRFNGQDQVAE